MDVTLTASDADEQDLWALRDSLAREPDLRGRLQSLNGAPPPGTMGPVTEALTAVLAPGGAAAAFAAVVITWLRLRKGSIRVRITRADGSSVEFAADRVRELDARAVRQQVADLTGFLGGGPGGGLGGGPGDDPGKGLGAGPGDDPGGGSGDDPGGSSGDDPGGGSGEGPGDDPGKALER